VNILTSISKLQTGIRLPSSFAGRIEKLFNITTSNGAQMALYQL
jgi:hypothetical protein